VELHVGHCERDRRSDVAVADREDHVVAARRAARGRRRPGEQLTVDEQRQHASRRVDGDVHLESSFGVRRGDGAYRGREL
jgi:hypothetical protein